MDKLTPEQEAERLYPINSQLEKTQLPIYKIQQLAHITAARMYMDTIEKLKAENERLKGIMELHTKHI